MFLKKLDNIFSFALIQACHTHAHIYIYIVTRRPEQDLTLQILPLGGQRSQSMKAREMELGRLN